MIAAEGKTLEQLKYELSSAEPMSLTGHEAWLLFLELKELDEIKEKEEKLHNICSKMLNTCEDIKRIYTR